MLLVSKKMMLLVGSREFKLVKIYISTICKNIVK